MLVDGEEREDRIRERVKKELKYAIFSHRWGEQEPLFHEMSKEPMEVPDVHRPGWKKLQRFCRAAKDVHDCEFAWSDTCCINKISSSELDESIRSMFRWYRNSHVCITFLSRTADFVALKLQEKEKEIDAWFERGWTLQELLAPSQIKFYGSNWEPLTGSMNDRCNKDIMDKISSLTGIDMKDLESFTPGIDRVPDKMLWASRRRTTRTEDMAYSLIGIFDISLMITYGEGNRAFFRLMEEIIKRYDKWDVFLWSGRCSRFNAALPDAPDSYTPRCHAPHCAAPRCPAPHCPSPHCCATGCIKTLQNTIDLAAHYEYGDRCFALTNHGLEIRVLLLTVNLKDTSEESPDSRSRCLSFEHEHFTVKARHIGSKPGRYDKSWAVGVLDYSIGDGGYVDRFPRETPYTAFLLSSDKHVPEHLPATGPVTLLYL
ncbi:hypothetical protein BDR07DRAFT_1409863 [Suillus spraguei]|nr:hypothetical protein BDR07DRAFT_1409863 [Suillus spraguei]